MQKGLALHQKGRLDNAVVLYRASQALRPNDSNALKLVGLVKFATVAANKALILIDRAAQCGTGITADVIQLRACPERARAVRFLLTYNNRAILLAALGRSHDALESY